MILLSVLIALLGLFSAVIFFFISIVNVTRKRAVKKTNLFGLISIIIFILFAALAFNLPTNSDKNIISESQTKEIEIEEVDESENNEDRKESSLTEYEKKDFKELSLEQLEKMQRKPDEHKKERVKFSGKILQIIPSKLEEYEVNYRIAINDDHDNVVYVQVIFPDKIEVGNLLEDDYITVYGWFDDIINYDSAGGTVITIPKFTAYGKLIELNDEQ